MLKEKKDHIFFPTAGVFAELECSMINGRTRAGIEKAKLNWEKSGRMRVIINSEYGIQKWKNKKNSWGIRKLLISKDLSVGT